MAMNLGRMTARADEPWRVIGYSLITAAIVVAALSLGPAPTEPIIPVAKWITVLMAWSVEVFRPLARMVSAALAWPLEYLQSLFVLSPWPIVLLVAGVIGALARGWRLALFCVAAFYYIILTGYWEKTALTMALVAVAIPLSALTGLIVGIWGAKSKRAKLIIGPTLDLMQTIPTFAYLIPILVMFGIGPIVGIVASAIYAMPPMVRNVMLALERVPEPVLESARMSGATATQLLWWVEVPSGLSGILIGLNQTIMAGLSMVVIAAMLGGVNDIGLEIFNTMKQAKFGESILAGLVITLLAMVMDRISRGFAEHAGATGRTRHERRRILIAAGALGATVVVLAIFFPQFRAYPQEWTIYPAGLLNDALTEFTVAAFPATSAIKSWTTFYLLLPMKVGIASAVPPASWVPPIMSVPIAYWTAVTVVAALLAFRGAWRALLFLLVVTALYYFGTTGIPWPVTIVAVTTLAFRVGGVGMALLASSGLAFILLNGIWMEAMVTVQLCIVGAALSFGLGSVIGVMAALDDRVSALVRPLCDTLQTLPIFVFLIPAIMVFLVGEFTALIAIVLYSFVPAIRYTEHGLRSIPGEIMEASRSMGTTKWQQLLRVQLPIALPEIMLGLNQVVMFALSMVVVAALVGAKGLGQEIMVALTHANTGNGLVVGLAVAFIAMIVDEILQAWSARKKREFNL